MKAPTLTDMALPPPQFLMAHAVLQAPYPVQRDPANDELFMAKARREFPNIMSRQMLPPEAPSQIPHLTLGGTSSQLALSSAQADFEVRFYGEYMRDLDRGLEYVEKKIQAVLSAYQAIDVVPSLIGLVGTLRFSLSDGEENAAQHLLRTHLRSGVDPETVQDAQLKLALKVRDTYFVGLTLANYEARTFERPIMPGMTELRIRPWEGEVKDTGLELTLDINNNLEARVHRADPEVTEEGVGSVVSLLREIATTAGPAFAETGTLSLEQLEAGSRS